MTHSTPKANPTKILKPSIAFRIFQRATMITGIICVLIGCASAGLILLTAATASSLGDSLLLIALGMTVLIGFPIIFIDTLRPTEFGLGDQHIYYRQFRTWHVLAYDDIADTAPAKHFSFERGSYIYSDKLPTWYWLIDSRLRRKGKVLFIPKNYIAFQELNDLIKHP